MRRIDFLMVDIEFQKSKIKQTQGTIDFLKAVLAKHKQRLKELQKDLRDMDLGRRK